MQGLVVRRHPTAAHSRPNVLPKPE